MMAYFHEGTVSVHWRHPPHTPHTHCTCTLTTQPSPCMHAHAVTHNHAHTRAPSPHVHNTHAPSQVYLGRYKDTDVFYAIKVLQKEAIVKCNMVKNIMAKRNNTTHPFLVGLHYSFQTSTNLYFVLDYVNGGALFFHLQREKVFEECKARLVLYPATIIILTYSNSL